MECQSTFLIFTLVISFTITKSEISSIPNSPDRVLLTLPSGDSLIGLEATTSNGRQYHAFLGVPYAQPPLEALRFERPLPFSAGGIGKVIDCTIEKQACSHYVLKTHKAPGCGLIDSVRKLKKRLKSRKQEKRNRKRTSTTPAPLPVTMNTPPFAPLLPTQEPPANFQLSDRFQLSGFQQYPDRYQHHHYRRPYNDSDSEIIRIKTRVHVVDDEYHEDEDYDDLDDNDLENEEEEIVEETTTAAPTTIVHKHRHQNDPRRPMVGNRYGPDAPQHIHLVTRIRQQDASNPRHSHNHGPTGTMERPQRLRGDGPQHIHLVTRIRQRDPDQQRRLQAMRPRMHSHGEEVDMERSHGRHPQNSRWLDTLVQSQQPQPIGGVTNRFGKHHTHDGDLPKQEPLRVEDHHSYSHSHDREEVIEVQTPKAKYHHPAHSHEDREEIIEVIEPRSRHHGHVHPSREEDRREEIDVERPRGKTVKSRPSDDNNQERVIVRTRVRVEEDPRSRHEGHVHSSREEETDRPRGKAAKASGPSGDDDRQERVIVRTRVKSGRDEEDHEGHVHLSREKEGRSGDDKQERVIVSTRVKSGRAEENPDDVTVLIDEEEGVVSCEVYKSGETSGKAKKKVQVCCETYDNEELNLKNGTRCRKTRRVRQAPSESTYEEDSCGHAHGTEDCLYLNVYAPVFNDDEIPRQLPIVVYVPASPTTVEDHRQFPALGIHGADRLLEQGIIVVVVTGRRTGALGYLCPPSGPAGNQAAADVLAALRWTHQNALAINGDPKRITAWGDGDGAALVHLAQIHTDTLPFTSVILTSGGTALAPWAAAAKPTDTFRYLALKHLAILADDRKRLDKLRRANHKKIQKSAAWIEYEMQLLGPGPWATGQAFASCVEHPAPRTPTDSIIPTYSHEKLLLGRAADVPMLIIHPDRKMYHLPSKKFKFWFGLRAALKPKKLVPEDMHVESKEKKIVASKIRHHYLLHRTTRKLKEAYLNYLVDSMYIRPTLKTAVLQARISKVWVARTSGPPPPSDAAATAHLLPPGRASFGIVNRVLGPNAPAGDAVSIAIANFVNRHDPGWLPVQANTTNQLACLNIGPDSSPYQHQVDYQHPDLHHLLFWDRLYDTYGYRPFNTY